MKRSSFLKSLLTLIVAPKVIGEMDCSVVSEDDRKIAMRKQIISLIPSSANTWYWYEDTGQLVGYYSKSGTVKISDKKNTIFTKKDNTYTEKDLIF